MDLHTFFLSFYFYEHHFITIFSSVITSSLNVTNWKIVKAITIFYLDFANKWEY